MAGTLAAALDTLEGAAKSILASAAKDARLPAAVGEPYLRLWGVVACGWQMAKAADISAKKLKQEDDSFYRNKIQTARFYFGAEMPKVGYLAEMINASARLVAEADASLFKVVEN